MAMKTLLFPLFALGLLLACCAVRADDSAVSRQVLKRQRADIEALFARESHACEARFAVNACLDEARGRYHASLSPLLAKDEIGRAHV